VEDTIERENVWMGEMRPKCEFSRMRLRKFVGGVASEWVIAILTYLNQEILAGILLFSSTNSFDTNNLPLVHSLVDITVPTSSLRPPEVTLNSLQLTGSWKDLRRPRNLYNQGPQMSLLPGIQRIVI
jgi:hypothetical protein